MNLLVGKPTGIALLMAAALIAALFAMGVFAPAGVHAGFLGGEDESHGRAFYQHSGKFRSDDDGEFHR